MLIIIKGRNRLGKSRSELENNLHKEWGCASLNHEEIDKCKYLEKKIGAGWIDRSVISNVHRFKR